MVPLVCKPLRIIWQVPLVTSSTWPGKHSYPLACKVPLLIPPLILQVLIFTPSTWPGRGSDPSACKTQQLLSSLILQVAIVTPSTWSGWSLAPLPFKALILPLKRKGLQVTLPTWYGVSFPSLAGRVLLLKLPLILQILLLIPPAWHAQTSYTWPKNFWFFFCRLCSCYRNVSPASELCSRLWGRFFLSLRSCPWNRTCVRHTDTTT